MPKTLAEIRDEIEARARGATPGSASSAILFILHDLVELLALSPMPAREADLQKRIDGLNAEINRQAGILEATKQALHIGDDKTMTQMPDEAALIYANSQKWKGTV